MKALKLTRTYLVRKARSWSLGKNILERPNLPRKKVIKWYHQPIKKRNVNFIIKGTVPRAHNAHSVTVLFLMSQRYPICLFRKYVNFSWPIHAPKEITAPILTTPNDIPVNFSTFSKIALRVNNADFHTIRSIWNFKKNF